MKYPVCEFVTDRTRKFAQELKQEFNLKSDRASLTLAAGLVGTHKTEEGAQSFPTIDWVKKKKGENKWFLRETAAAIPVYQTEDSNDQGLFMRIDETNGSIILNTMKGVEAEQYVSQLKENLKLQAEQLGYPITDKQLAAIENKSLAYRFLLYTAKSLLVNMPQNATEEQQKEVQRDAMNEAFSALSVYKSSAEYKQGKVDIEKMNATIDALNEFVAFLGAHVHFNEEGHIYSFDGQTHDYLASNYARICRGDKDPFNGKTHWSTLGTEYDQIWRDYDYEKHELPAKEYKNFTKAQLDAVVKDIRRFENLLKRRYGKYRVITDMPGMFGFAQYQDGQKRKFAGTPDLVVIDGKGDIHIFDMKAKTESQTINTGNNYADYVTQQNIYRLLMEMFPKLKGKVKSLELIWGKTRWPSNNSYTIDDDGTINAVHNVNNKTEIKHTQGYRQPQCDVAVRYDALGNTSEEIQLVPIDITNEVKVRLGKNVQLPVIQMMPVTVQPEINGIKKEDYDFLVRQVLDDFKAAGINVHTRNELVEFLKDHNYNELLAALEERKEMNAIKEEALANGTFMLAPNGKPTNLTERQWLQVRTKAFKEWFGDWESYQKLQNATVIWGHPGTGKTWLFKQGRTDIIDFDSEYKAQLGNVQEREALKKKIGKEAYNKKLDELFTQAREEAIKSGRKLLVSDLHFLRDRSNDLDVVTNISDVEFIKRSHQRGEHDEADKMDWKNSINKAMQNVAAEKRIDHTGYISDLLDGTNASKVVDENGEPLVVYHNTKNEFTKFSKFRAWLGTLTGSNMFGTGFYFSNQESNILGNINMPVFLSIKNPSKGDMSSENDGMIHSFGDGTVWFAAKKPNQIKSATDNNGMFSRENNDIQAMMLGARGAGRLDYAEEATTRMDNLSTAIEMSKAGKDALTIKIATGWERGADYKWRYEVPDIQLNGGALYKALHGHTYPVKLVNLVAWGDENFKKLLEAYPELKDYRITFRPVKGTLGHASTEYQEINLNPETLGIKYGYITDDKTDKVRSTLLHEIQHIIQGIEGFAKGGSPSKYGYEKYWRLAGEVESRAVSKRRDLSAQERLNSLLTDDMYKDVAKDDLIILGVNLKRNSGRVALPFYLLKTNSGDVEVYGFIDPDTDEMYLDETVINLEHPVHEYTHIWDKYVAKVNPDFWKIGVDILKKTSEWQKVLDDPNYGQKWKAMGMDEAHFEFMVASEVHSRLTGRRGKHLLEKLAKEQGSKGIHAKLKQWLLDFWKTIKSAFSQWSVDQLQRLDALAEKDIDKAIDYLSDMTLKDFAEGVNPITGKSRSQQQQAQDQIIPSIPQRVFVANTLWTRDSAFKDSSTLYIFGDNAQRSSGQQTLYSESWYQKKYGKGRVLKFPTQTAAVIRGLDNAFPVTTVKQWIPGNRDYDKVRYFDTDLEEFKKQIKDDFDQIIAAWDTGKYQRIMMPQNGLFSSTISWITKERSPQIFEALRDELKRLYKHIYKSEFKGKAKTKKQQEELDKLADSYAEGMLPLSIHSKRDEIKKIEAPSSLPAIGRGAVRPNVNDQITQMHMQMAPQEISLRVSNITRFFEDALIQVSNEKIEENERLISESESDDERRRLQNEIERLQPEHNKDWQRETVNICGIDNIINVVRNRFEELSQDSSTVARNAALKVLNNFNALMSMSVPSISHRLGITLFYSLVDNGAEVQLVGGAKKREATDTEGETAEETNKTAGNESYLYKAKFQNSHLTINKRVKRLLSDIYQGEWDPKTKSYDGLVDEFFEYLYIPEKITYTTLKNALRGMRDSDDFAVRVTEEEDQSVPIDQREIVYRFPVLEKLVDKHPWVQLVIQKLESEPDLVPLFYAAMREEVTWYDIQIPNAQLGHITPIHVNQSVTNEVILKTAENLYNAHIITNDECIWDTKGERDKAHAQKLITKTRNLEDNMDAFKIKNMGADVYFQQASEVLHSVGIVINPETLVMIYDNYNDKFAKILAGVKSIAGIVLSDNYNDKKSLIDNASGYYGTIAEQLIDYIQIDIPATHRQGDKSLPNFSVPDALDILAKNLAGDEYETYLRKEFQFDSWYFKDGQYRGFWMRDLADENNELLRKMLKLTNLYQVRGPKSNIEYQKWKPFDIDVNFIVRYYSDYAIKNDGNRYVELPVPILSDSETALFVRFKQYQYLENDNDVEEKRGGEIVSGLVEIALQELDRMHLVDVRAQKGMSKIAYFDEGRGSEFCFLPFLEERKDYYRNLHRQGRMEELKAVLRAEIYEYCKAECAEFIAQVTRDKSYEAIKQNLEKMSIVAADSEFAMNEALKTFYMNFMFAQANIVQLTVKDYAFYRDLIDFQKRFKQVYASGKRLFTNSRYGKKIEKAIYVKDYIGTSRSWKAFERVLNAALEAGYLGDKNNVGKMNRDNILRSLKKINATDAQALRTLESYRAVMDMAGRWDEQQDAAMARIVSGKYDMADINMIWQTIKPFIFTSTRKDDGNGGEMKVYHQNKNSEFLLLAAYTMMETAVQKSGMMVGLNKWMLKNDIDVMHFESAVKTGNQGVIEIHADTDKVINACMKINENYDAKHKPFEIKVQQVEALRKDLANNAITKEQYDARISALSPLLFNQLKKYLDSHLDDGTLTQDQYNDIIESVTPNEEEIQALLDTQVFKHNDDGSIMKDADGNNVFDKDVVHEFSYEDYIIQQETPEHVIDAETIVGSQFRMLLTADLPKGFTLKLRSNGKVYELNREQVIQYFRKCLSENIIEDYMKVRDDFSNIDKLSESLIKQVQDNEKYDNDMVEALRVIEVRDPFDSSKTMKVFNIPFDNPTTVNKIEELLLSKFKNRITKQYMRGGNAILVSSIGYTNELKIEYYDEDVIVDGQVLHKKGDMKGYQAYLPATSRKFFEPLMKKTKDGIFYLDFSKLDDDLKEALGYRIPTEDKYSMIPIIIKGFLPENNGSAIMLPMEITKFGGMDFDVDKEFLIFPEFEVINKYDYDKMQSTFLKEHPQINEQINANRDKAFKADKEEWLKKHPDYAKLGEGMQFAYWLQENMKKKKIFDWTDDPQKTKETYGEWKKHNKKNFIISTTVRKVQYDLDQVQKEGIQSLTRPQRNNLFLDIAREVLKSSKISHLTTASNNFDDIELYAHMFNTLNVPEIFKQYTAQLAERLGRPVGDLTAEEIQSDIRQHIDAKDTDYFYEYTKGHMKKVNPLSFNTWKMLHQSNMAGAALIGIYANQNTGHAKFQGSELGINPAFSISIDKGRYLSLHDIKNAKGVRILANTTQLSAASVDNGKKQVLDKVGQTTDTANITSYLLRLGYSIEQVLMFMGQPSIKNFISQGDFSKKAFDKYEESLRDKTIAAGVSESSIPSTHSETTYEFESSDFMKHMIQVSLDKMAGKKYDKDTMLSQYKAFLAFRYRVYPASKDLQNFVQQTRGDSPNGALSPFLNEALAQRYAYKALIVKSRQNTFALTGLSNILESEEIDEDNPESIRKAVENCPNLLWKTFQLCGKEYAYKLLKEHINILHPNSTRILDYIMGTQYSLDPYNTKVLIRNYIKAFTTYVLSETQLFGDEENGPTFQEKAYYYRRKFPQEFVNMVKNNKVLSSNPILSKIIVRRDGTLGVNGSARMEKEERERYKYAMDELLYMAKQFKDDGTVDRDTVIMANINGEQTEITGQEIAVHLLRYSYYAEQLYFTPNSIGTFFSSQFLLSFPEYIDTLRRVGKELDNDVLLSSFESPLENGFLAQFFYNNMYALAPTVGSDEGNGKPHTINDEIRGYLFHLGHVTMYNQLGNARNTLFPFIKTLVRDKEGNESFKFFKLNPAYYDSQYAEYQEIEYNPMIFFYKRGSDTAQVLDAYKQYLDMFPKVAESDKKTTPQQSNLTRTADDMNTGGFDLSAAQDYMMQQMAEQQQAMDDFHDAGSDTVSADALREAQDAAMGEDERNFQNNWQSTWQELNEMRQYVAQQKAAEDTFDVNATLSGMAWVQQQAQNNAPSFTPSQEAQDKLGKKCD